MFFKLILVPKFRQIPPCGIYQNYTRQISSPYWTFVVLISRSPQPSQKSLVAPQVVQSCNGQYRLYILIPLSAKSRKILVQQKRNKRRTRYRIGKSNSFLNLYFMTYFYYIINYYTRSYNRKEVLPYDQNAGDF
jgi:hypothetical protein